MEIYTRSWCAAVLTLIFKVTCLVIMGLEHWTRLCVSSKRGNLEWDYCWKFSFSKQKERVTKKVSEEEEKWSEVAQSCPTLCDPMDCSPPGSSVHVIFQAGVLEWGAFWGGRDQLRMPCTPPLQVVTVLTKNSSQYSLVKEKKYVAGTLGMKHKSFRALVLAVPSSGLLARPFPHFLYLNIYEPHSFLSTGLLASGGEGNGNPLQYSCLGNPMDGGAW